MSSWRYAFYFPRHANSLKPEMAIHDLSNYGFHFDNTIRLCEPIDDHGHLLDSGDEFPLNEPRTASLEGLLLDEKQFSVQCRDKYMILSCMFAYLAPNPHFYFGWSNKLHSDMPIDRQARFYALLKNVAKQVNAGYVIIVDDALELFEDTFLDIDGTRVLDAHHPHYVYNHGIQELWVQSGERVPEGVDHDNPEEIGNGFYKFSVPT